MSRRRSRHRDRGRSSSIGRQLVDRLPSSVYRPVQVRSVARPLYHVQPRVSPRRVLSLNPALDIRHAPRRVERQKVKSVLQAVLPYRAYKQVHNCKREWSKLLSWRASRGPGRGRSVKELVNNRKSFDLKDC